MPVITENQLDPVQGALSGRIITEADLDPIKPQQNVARERVSIGGEFVGGIKDFFEDIIGANVPKEAGTVEAILHRLRAPLGLIRAAASPLAPLTNLASGAGEKVSNITPDVSLPGGLNLKDVTGGLAQSIIDVIGPTAISKLSKAAAPIIQRARPLRSEKIAAVRSEGVADEAAIAARAKESTRKAETLREEQIKQLEEAKKTVPSAEEIAFNKEAQQRQLQELGDKEIEAVRKVAEKQLAPSAGAAEDARLLATDAPTAEEVGKQFIGKTYPTKLAASKKRFNEEYQAVLDEGSTIESSASSYKVAAEGLFGEQGAAKVLPTSAEVSAGKISKALDIEDEAYKNARSFFTSNQGVADEKLIAEFSKQNPLSVGEKSITVDKLILDRQRLKAAERAAYDSGKTNLGRQFKQLRQGIEADLAESGIAEKLSIVDKAYATEHIPFFGPKATTKIAAERSAESVVDRFIPKNTDPNRIEKVTRAFQLLDDPEPVRKAFINKGIEEATQAKDFGEGLVKWWSKYADEAKTGDKVLKTALGDQYVHLKDIVTRLRTVKPKEIDKALSSTVAELEKRTVIGVKGIEKAQVERLKSVEGLLAEGRSFEKTLFERTAKKTELIAKERDEAIKKIRKEVEVKLQEITGEKSTKNLTDRVKNYGMFLMIEGSVSAIVGSPTGGMRAMAGGLMILTPQTVARLIKLPGGLQLFRRGLRVVPGTTQASATARQIQNLLQKEESE